MKIGLSIFIIFILFIAYYYYKTSKAINGLDYNVDFKSIDFSQFNFGDVLNQGGKVKAKLQIQIKNQTDKSLSFRNLNITAIYNNTLILNSSKDELQNFVKINIPAYSVVLVDQVFDVYLNQSSLDLIGKIKNHLTTIINYNIKVNWYGINISQDSTYQIN